MKTTVVVKGISKITRKLTAYAAKLSAPEAMWEVIGQELGAAELAWFQSQGDGSWKPLSAEYAASKGGGLPILVLSGDLRDWMSNPAKAMRITSPLSMQWVNGRETPDGRWNIAELHRDGTAKMPARSPVVPTARIHEIAVAAARVHAAWA
jgi:hypothetical protein